MTPLWQLILIGIVSGTVSGLIGIGGGIIIVPALMLLCGFPQLTASGTSLAILLLPVGLAAVLQYYKTGNVDIRAAVVIALTFAITAWGGAYLSKKINPIVLRYLFGGIVTAVGIYIIVSTNRPLR